MDEFEYEDLNDNIRVVFDKLKIEKTKENVAIFIEVITEIKNIFWNDIDKNIRQRYGIKK